MWKIRKFFKFFGFDELIFENEYFNGERNGKGKEYHQSCKLRFEGSYKNRKRNGIWKEYF